ncbi:4'-phosphopantetheinyl transferase family protein [Paracoccus jeotgali]|uniref:4'-phosphopantetheinyl transferase family protein n=1 Tax=Paracoccus jeotgali TaxID=2065379 RepID=UPI0028A8C9BD|nr:4'-phosphopantetheinyl transferase superfamily protein [Paracoccus jeotgali]
MTAGAGAEAQPLSLDLWQWRLDGRDACDLSADEQARAARFVFDRDRARYIAGRAALRRILGRYLGRAPRDIRFRYGAFGRPLVAGLSFNLSHTGDLAALVVAPVADLPLGIDIETVRPIEMAVAEAHFAAPEMATLRALPDAGQQAAFYRCWTRKEAYLKAIGTGLSTDLSSFCVTLAPGDPPRLLSCAGDEPGRWTLLDLATPEGIAGALAIRNCGRPIRLRLRGAP